MLKQPRPLVSLWIIVLASVLCPGAAVGEKHSIDVERSTITIHVLKAGMFSAFAHNHEITAPIVRGDAETGEKPSIAVQIEASKLRVVDPKVSPAERAKVQKTMEGAEVLDVNRFPEIRFQSTAVEKAGPSQWTMRGTLALHGQTRPVAVEVRQEKDGSYSGSAVLKQREFGMTPIKLAGGTVRVKDEVRIEFAVWLKP